MLVLESKGIRAGGMDDGTDAIVEIWIDPETADLPPEQQRRSVVMRRKSLPALAVETTRGRFAADGLDYAEVIARVQDPWETELQDHPVYLIIGGSVVFEVNLTEASEPLDGTGKATFRLSTTTPGAYTIRARLDGYGEASAQVEAVMV